MRDVFQILGIKPTDDKERIRAAYHKQVKKCHPDKFSDEAKQKQAQDRLIELNLAYEQAIKLTCRKDTSYHNVPAIKAKKFAINLLEGGEAESALRQLQRADSKDDEWYYIEGKIMMSLRQYEAAHRSFREAVRRSPDNMDFRAAALEAALEVKKRKKTLHRIWDSIHERFRRFSKKRRLFR
ncbi:MAG: J domain-containing protein [Christensenellaceae bacterium]|nr:J domain-containing protein [Christensenellaceae bacterium]